jgi:hypothetical protein
LSIIAEGPSFNPSTAKKRKNVYFKEHQESEKRAGDVTQVVEHLHSKYFIVFKPQDSQKKK